MSMEDFNDKYKKKNPFVVPDGYFDDLTGRVMRRVEVSERSKKKRPVRYLRSFMRWAAVFVGALFVVQVFYIVVLGSRFWENGDGTEHSMYTTEMGDADIFDSNFNPTDDEIIEYLATEMNNYEWMIAGIY